MADQGDGIDEAFEAALRVGLTAAGRMAERVAREREQQQRDAQARSEQEARELQARLDSERAAARAALAPVEQEQWWQSARPEEIADAWQTANAWKDTDPEAQRATERIGRELQERHGIDPSQLSADPGAVRDALERRDEARLAADRQRVQARGEHATATALLAEPDTDQAPTPEHEERERAEQQYDSTQRREELAEQLEAVGDTESAQARVLADRNQGRPAQHATAERATRAPAKAARRSPGQARRQPRREDRGR